MIFIQKEIKHIIRDPRTLLLLIGMPVVQLILFGFAISTEIRNSSYAVFDPSNDNRTRAIIEKLDASSYFSTKRVLTNPSEINSTLVRGDAPMVVIFPNNFEKRLKRGESPSIQLIADGADPNTANMIINYASRIILSSSDKKVAPKIVPQVQLLFNPAMKGAYNFVPGVLGMILMLICAMMTSIAIVREKERGTMELLLVSPMPPLLILLAKIVPYFLLSLLNFAIIISVSIWVIGVPVAGSFAALFLLAQLFILSALSLGILISTKTNSQVVAMLISGMMFMLPVILLSGMMFPIDNMPKILQFISMIIPARWFISATRSIMIQGQGFGGVIKELTILGSMALVLIIVSLKQFKTRLE